MMTAKEFQDKLADLWCRLVDLCDPDEALQDTDANRLYDELLTAYRAVYDAWMGTREAMLETLDADDAPVPAARGMGAFYRFFGYPFAPGVKYTFPYYDARFVFRNRGAPAHALRSVHGLENVATTSAAPSGKGGMMSENEIRTTDDLNRVLHQFGLAVATQDVYARVLHSAMIDTFAALLAERDALRTAAAPKWYTQCGEEPWDTFGPFATEAEAKTTRDYHLVYWYVIRVANNEPRYVWVWNTREWRAMDEPVFAHEEDDDELFDAARDMGAEVYPVEGSDE